MMETMGANRVSPLGLVITCLPDSGFFTPSHPLQFTLTWWVTWFGGMENTHAICRP